jgi:hypothetical protein
MHCGLEALALVLSLPQAHHRSSLGLSCDALCVMTDNLGKQHAYLLGIVSGPHLRENCYY